MDVRSKFIALGLYVVLGALTVILAYGAVSYFQPEVESHSQLMERVRPPGMPVVIDNNYQTRQKLPDFDSLYSEQLQVAVIKQMFAETSGRLRDKAALLKKRADEFNALKRQYELAVAQAIELLPQKPDRATDANLDDEGRRKLEQEASELQRRQTELASELQRLRSELAEVELEVSILRDDAEREIAALFRSESDLRQAAAETLARIGSTAVPSVLRLLESTNPNIRIWGVRVLDEIGVNAADALNSLKALSVNDPDDDVRDAARRAVNTISNSRSY